MTADRDHVRRALLIDEREVTLTHLAGTVEPGVVRRDVDVENSRRRILELLGERLEPRVQLILAGLTLGVPRSHLTIRVRAARGGQPAGSARHRFVSR